MDLKETKDSEKSVIRKLLFEGEKAQSEGRYQEATKNFLKALDAIYLYIEDHNQNPDKNTSDLVSLRASLISCLGDNLVYVGQYEIAVAFYNQQIEIANIIGSSFDLAAAYHKFGFCQYLIDLYDSSIEFQERSLNILQSEGEESEYLRLRCRILLCLALNRYALGDLKLATKNYEEGLAVAQQHDLQDEEILFFAYLSSLIRDNIELKKGSISLVDVDDLLANLHYTKRVASKKPYIKTLTSIEIAKMHKVVDLDMAKKHLEDALGISREYNFPFQKYIQNELKKVCFKRDNSLNLDYVVEEQEWYCKELPSFPEISFDEQKTVDFLIVTATPVELISVLRLLTSNASDKSFPYRLITRFGRCYLGMFGCYKIVVTQCRMGSHGVGGAEDVTKDAIDMWSPKAVIMVGIAFGKDSTTQDIGDVIVATEIVNYEEERIGLNESVARGSHAPSDRRLLIVPKR